MPAQSVLYLYLFRSQYILKIIDLSSVITMKMKVAETNSTPLPSPCNVSLNSQVTICSNYDVVVKFSIVCPHTHFLCIPSQLMTQTFFPNKYIHFCLFYSHIFPQTFIIFCQNTQPNTDFLLPGSDVMKHGVRQQLTAS